MKRAFKKYSQKILLISIIALLICWEGRTTPKTSFTFPEVALKMTSKMYEISER